jgi:hypothetical protein
MHRKYFQMAEINSTGMNADIHHTEFHFYFKSSYFHDGKEYSDATRMFAMRFQQDATNLNHGGDPYAPQVTFLQLGEKYSTKALALVTKLSKAIALGSYGLEWESFHSALDELGYIRGEFKDVNGKHVMEAL